MTGRRIQVGQVWKESATGEMYLVTKIYTEALTSIAVLRKTGAELENRVRARIELHGDDQVLQGFTFAQQSEEF